MFDIRPWDVGPEEAESVTAIIREIHHDGMTQTHHVDATDDGALHELTNEILWRSIDIRKSTLGEDDLATYDSFYGRNECRCDGSCDYSTCWYDYIDADHWLDAHAPGGVIIDWQIRYNGNVAEQATDVVTVENTIVTEEGRLWTQIVRWE